MNGLEVAVAFGGVALGALWTSGGPGAVQRRTIQHELDHANGLHDAGLRARMVRRAEDRTAIYLARGLPSDDSTRTMVLTLVPLVFGMAIACGAHLVGPPPVVLAAANLVSFMLLGVGLGAMADSVMRDVRAGLTGARVRQARHRLRTASLPGLLQDREADTPGPIGAVPPPPGLCRDEDLPSAS